MRKIKNFNSNRLRGTLLMRLLGHVLCYIFLFVILGCKNRNENANAHLFQELDKELSSSDTYQKQKEERINNLKNELSKIKNPESKIPVINILIDEYDSYSSDSALNYINRNIENLKGLKYYDENDLDKLMIRKANVLSHAGLFEETEAILGNINSGELTDENKILFYETYIDLYQFLIDYTSNPEINSQYNNIRSNYIDSLLSLTDSLDFIHVLFQAPGLLWTGDTLLAENIVKEALENYESGKREYSMLAYILAYIYKRSGDEEKQNKYLVLSAISDIKGVVKENSSFRELAGSIFDAGDVERANRYLKKSIDDANFYSARVRTAQANSVLPMIDRAFVSAQEGYQHKLRVYIWVISALALCLIISMIFIIRQMKNLRQSNIIVSSSNEDLRKLNDDLKSAQENLSLINRDLKESNRIKEEYLGVFMQYCSLSISTMQKFILSLRKLIMKGDYSGAVRKIDSTEAVDATLRDFYQTFDEAFLNLYPAFVDHFNDLLKPEDRIIIKVKNQLTTELRVFALIRLGFYDSGKIAEFLRCSLTTVYTYRSKIKKRALDPDSFEDAVAAL